MNWFYKSIKWIDAKVLGISAQGLELIASILLIGIVLITVGDISFRTVGRSSMVGVLEVTEVLMAGVVFLVLAAVQRRDQHVKIDFFINHLPEKAQVIFKSVALLVALVISVLFLWQSVVVAYDSWLIKEVRHGLLPVPIWPARIMVALGFLFLSAQLGIDLIRRCRQIL